MPEEVQQQQTTATADPLKKPNGAPPPETKAAEPDGELRKENDRLKQRLAEVEAAERYYAGMYEEATRGRKQPDEPKDPEVDDDGDTFLEELTSSGAKALEKRGYVRKADVEKLVQERIAKAEQNLRVDTAIQSKYPDLLKKDSPLFAETAMVLRELKDEDPGFKQSTSTLLTAAKIAQARLDAKKATAPPDENERQRRIDAQAGQRGRGTATGDEEPQDFSPFQRRVLDELQSHGYKEEDIRKNMETSRSKGGSR